MTLYFGSTTTGALREVDSSGHLWNVTNFGAAQSALAFDSANQLYASEPYQNEVVEVSGLDPVTSKGNLVALGDSVAAGEGINYGFIWNPATSKWNQSGPSDPSWTDTTSAIGTNFQGCHQTDYAYDRLLQANGYTVHNMACTGASVLQNSGLENGGILDNEILGDGTSPPAQVGGTCTGCDAPNTVFDRHQPTVVTLTIGGNDLNFANWVFKCYQPFYIGPKCGTTADTSLLNSELAIEQADLRSSLTELNRRAGINLPAGQTMRVLVTDYYNPFQSTYVKCIDTDAGALSNTPCAC
jgi:hypothetical protein